MKRIAVSGRTGSIGCNTPGVVEHLGPGCAVTPRFAHALAHRLRSANTNQP